VPLKLIPGNILIKKLEDYTAIRAPDEPGYTRVKSFIIIKVAAPVGDDDAAIKEKKTLYAGMPILINNPAAADVYTD